MRKVLALSALFALVAFTADSNAQRPPFGSGGGTRGGLTLLSNKSVQEELKITDEQKEKIAAGQKEAFSKVGGLFKKDTSKEDREKLSKELQESSNKVIADVLKPEQAKRFKQIERQQNVLGSLTNNDEVKKELKVSEEQLEKFKGISEEMTKEMTGLFSGFKDNPKETQEKIAALRKEATEKAISGLTDDQKKQWKEMTGEPFEVKFEAFRPKTKDKDN